MKKKDEKKRTKKQFTNTIIIMMTQINAPVQRILAEHEEDFS